MITTPRLLIRPFQEKDYPDLHAYLSDPAVYRFEPGAPVSLEEAREMAIQRAHGTHYWAVILQAADRLIGHLYFAQTGPLEFSTWELGYIFNPAYQNQGYATEAAAALLRHGFVNWGIHRVTAHCNPENTASWRVMEKIGMRREGFFRKNIFFQRDENNNPLWLDSFEYAGLREEFTSEE